MDRQASETLSDRLLAEPFHFDFFQAVRLLELLAREQAARDPRRPSSTIGLDVAPHHEHVRFRAHPTLGFPAAPLAQVRESDGGRPSEAAVAFLGLFGPLGALPQHYTSLLLRRIRARDFALRDFLDLVNHRAISLFYRAWEKYRLPWSYERSRRDGVPDPISQSIYCLTGFGTGGLRGRQRVTDETILFYAGHLAHYPRSAVALEAMLADYFDLPVEVEQAHGQWLTLADTDCSCLPGSGEPAGCNNALGVSVFLGERVWDVQSKFRVRVGPLRYAEFRKFMPDGDALEVLCHLARTFAGPDLDFDVLPVLRRSEVPRCQLGGDGADAPRLGWNTWVHEDAYDEHRTDAVFFLDSGTGGG